ncbi:MAG: transcription termination/antitermination protein NusG [Candidatus Cyclobacteriaceae bacterium M2_1C_046]
MSDKHWYVFYTKARWEKKTKQNLEKFGFEVLLPTIKVMRQWSDRKKKLEVPLFNSYIFVKEEEHRIVDIMNIPGVSWNIRQEGKPAYLRDEELKMIKRLTDSGYAVEAEGYDELEKGDEVEIIDGPLKGFKGIIDNSVEKNFRVIIPSIGQAVKVQIDKVLLKKL